MTIRPTTGVTITASGDDVPPGPATDVIHALWFVAGAAMLLFTAFLVVLVLAGIAFRVGPKLLRRSSVATFGISTIPVAVAAAALLLPNSFHGVEASFTSGSIKSTAGEGARRAAVGTAAIQPAALGTPRQIANGAASGNGLARATTRSLLLYDAAGADPTTMQLRATLLANLVSHFGGWTAHPVGTYRSGEIARYDAVFYLGGPNDTTLPRAFLDDTAQSKRPVVWIGDDITQLTGAASGKAGYGFTTQGKDTSALVRMTYQSVTLAMNQDVEPGFTRIAIADTTAASVLATAYRTDGSSVPWAVRSGSLIYFCEDPLGSQSTLEGRNLAFTDLLFEVLDRNVKPRHRALIRLEDVNPTTDPAALRSITDYLSGQHVPFSIGVYPVFTDPNGANGDPGTDTPVRLSQRPELVSALRYAAAHGGTLVLHGYTHQYASKKNPYSGRSGDDVEFYLCHLDEAERLQLDGPVPEDSGSWALDRVDRSLAEFQAAGLTKPSIFEFPHYLGSADDYLAIGQRFSYRYERSLYFPGLLTEGAIDTTRPIWQLFPFAVRDVYGTAVIPENLDYVHSDGDSISTMLATARSNLVVRDGVASFFYHPLLGLGQLPKLVDGLREIGYTFVAARDVAGAS